MAGRPTDVGDSSFDSQVVKSEEPVLVDFWAPWCPPCKVVGPIVDELASSMQGRLKVCKVNVDENPGTAQTYEIRVVPTLVLFRKGRVVKRLTGVLPREEIEREIEAGIK